MKKILYKYLQKTLFILARMILKKYQPKIVGITGSVGKSSAKEAIFSVLQFRFKVRKNIKNYNNEIGVPLTIIGLPSGGRSIFSWIKIILYAFKLIILVDKNYPEILVLEMGVDHPGDMKYLTDLVFCDIGVITNIGPVHLEFFKTIDKIAKEKSLLISQLNKNGWGILNCDNEYVCAMKDSVKGRFLTYGFSNEAMLRAIEHGVSFNDLGEPTGLSFKISYDGKVVPVFLPGALADHQVYAALAGAAVGIVFDMNLIEISQALKNFVPPKGRLHLISGINGSRIIDDTYNASPEATVAAVRTLTKINSRGVKYVVLGDMLELGDFEIEGHQLVGKEIAQGGINFLITVGNRAKIISQTAIDNGFDPDSVWEFSSSSEAGEFLIKKLRSGDLVLIKGSQGMRMEHASKIILADSEMATELLVRQDGDWQNK